MYYRKVKIEEKLNNSEYNINTDNTKMNYGSTIMNSKIFKYVLFTLVLSIIYFFILAMIYQQNNSYQNKIQNNLINEKIINSENKTKIQIERENNTEKTYIINNNSTTVYKNFFNRRKKIIPLTLEKIKKFVGDNKVKPMVIILYCIFYDKEDGFYIDVGANDPNIDSITKTFYINGWNGINIEPVPELFEQYWKYRPNDINIGKAISDDEGKVKLYVTTDNYKYSTIISEYKNDYGNNTKEIMVDSTTLGNICIQYIRDVKIDFLKIDVVGAEKNVLLGHNFKKYRPKVIIVNGYHLVNDKATPNYDDWEFILIRNYYSFIYENGFDRYYSDNRVMGLKERFGKVEHFLEEFYKK